MTKKDLFIPKNTLQKSILTLVFAICPIAMAQKSQNSLDLANKELSDLFFDNKTPEEILCLQAFDRCEQEYNQVMSLIPKENISLKEQLIQARVTTMYTIARSSAISFAAGGDIARALAVLSGLHVKLHEYTNKSEWDRLIIQASPTLQARL